MIIQLVISYKERRRLDPFKKRLHSLEPALSEVPIPTSICGIVLRHEGQEVE